MMRVKDLTIGVQLKIVLGVILALVAILGVTALVQNENLWLQTKGLYEHPLQVQKTVGKIRANILAIHREMKDLFLSGNESERIAIIKSIDFNESNARMDLDILYKKYLGKKEDVERIHEALVQWKVIRDETIRLLREGYVTEAAGRTKLDGVGDAQARKVMDYLVIVDNFANSRSERFYRDAESHKDDLMLHLGVLIAAIILFSAVLGYFLLRGIRDPLDELTTAALDYQQGAMDARCSYSSQNEFGTLATAFNALAASVQANIGRREKISRIADVMLREDDLKPFCRGLLSALLEHTGSQVGAVYLLNEQKKDFEHFESIGLTQDARSSFRVTQGEGEFGAALASRNIQRISDIPEDTRFTLLTVTGEIRPREIITIPILSGHDVSAMISLASVRNYDDQAHQLLGSLWDVMNARLNGVLAFQKIREFSEKLEKQTAELEAQKRELSMQADELSEQNIELEMQKRQLGEADNLKNSFISNMSHELRTPLNSVIALSSVLSRRLATLIPNEEYGYLEVIERNGRRLLALINDILDLERIESGRQEIYVSSFSISQIVDGIVEMLEPQAREKNISLVSSITNELPNIDSDSEKFSHIMQNIIANAVKFTEVGHVDVSAVQLENSIRISVSDTGIGIPEDRMGCIFDEFRQADESMSKRYGGTGLGLAIAKKYATLIKGQIEVQSLPGEGSTFTLTLPLDMGAPRSPGHTNGKAQCNIQVRTHTLSSAPMAQGGRILLVEDSEPAIIQIKDMLCSQGYDVSLARNGREALESIEHEHPDAVILDLMMPEIDGFGVLEKLRADVSTRNLPVLILTARQVTREELKSLKGNHVHQLIQKGAINANELLSAVAGLLKPGNSKTGVTGKPTFAAVTRDRPVVLVVEDNPDNMLTVKAVLQKNYHVIEAIDGKQGIEQAVTHKPDLILMDISLPVMDGTLALKGIREQEILRDVPVVALTASAMKGNREDILALGFDGYISKPIEPQAFLDTIREILHARGQSQDIGHR
jgi:signal transduction histidine kinase/CheY-like chemotaxis protein/HAMP domain-containing protein